MEIVIFDPTAPVGEGEAVYVTATATVVADDHLEAITPEAFRTTAGARRLTVDDLRHADMSLYVAHLKSCEVHVPGNHPIHAHGVDTRQPADPTSPVR